ncbi:hemagglutinin repeat-containing protein [Lysobacter sp. FW306-1B-D06B]|uniref:two-partner secretion domain-containing protein n=1 Tax=Lysobacter sp. FW306-1B-D06B TaxID=3140250 RepID=UPI00314050C3
MNRIYRLVFNRELGLVQVTSELVTSPQGGTDRGGGVRTAVLPALRFAMYVALGFVTTLPAFAQAVQGQIVGDPSAPGNQRPQVLEAPNGTPLVNITTPSAAGVSRNQYSRFDVGPENAILNNSRENTQTQVGGWVQGNPWLATGEARVILNEVNSANPSHLNGYVEVAGRRAEVIIANPAGIQVAGGGFINSDRVTLTTGRPILNNGALDGYRVEGSGVLQVDGAGLDTSGADYTDLIARSVQLNAGVWANRLKVTTGANTVSADHTQITAIEGASGAAPQFTIDVSALGGMYAHHIALVATENGVGVRNAGTIGAQTGELTVTVDGRIENTGALQSQTNTTIAASGGAANAGTISAGRELTITTPVDVDNGGGTLNARRVEVNAQSLQNRDGAIQQAGLQALALNAGTLTNRDAGRIGVAAPIADGGGGGSAGGSESGSDPNSGSGSGGQDGGGSTGGGTLPLPEPLADGVLNIAGVLNNDGGRIEASGVDLAASGGLNNDGGHLGLRDLRVDGGHLGNAGGELTIGGMAALRVESLNNDAGRLNVGGPLTLDAQTVFNRAGTLSHSGTDATALNVAGTLDNSDGTIASNASSLTLNTGSFVNERGQLQHAGANGLQIHTGTLSGAGGTIATAGAVNLAAGQVDHRGATLSATQVTLTADNFDSRGGHIIASGEAGNTLNVHGTLDNGDAGTIESNGDLAITATTFGNAGGTVRQVGAGALAINADTLNGAGGTLASNGALSIAGDATDLRNGTTLAQRIAIDTGTLTTAGGSLTATSADALDLRVRGLHDNTAGTIATKGALNLEAGALTNTGGSLSSASTDASRVAVAGALDNTRGTVGVSGDLTVTTDTLVNRDTLSTDPDAPAKGIFGDSVTVASRTVDNANGQLAANDTLTLTAQALDNTGGAVTAVNGLGLDVVTLDGTNGTLATDGTLTLTGETTNLRGGTTQASRIAIETGSLTTAGGTLSATGTDTLDLRVRGALDNAAGTIATNGALQLDAATLTNTDGVVSAAGEASSRVVVAQTLDNTRGTIATGGVLDVTADRLVNRDTLVTDPNAAPKGILAQQVSLTARQLDNGHGQIGANGAVQATADTVDNWGGLISAGDTVGFAVTQALDNRGGTVVATNQATVRAGTVLNGENGAIVSTEGDLQLSADGLLDNTGGTLQGKGDVTLDSTGLTNAGGVVVGANTTIDTRQQALDNTGGTIAATASTLAIDSGALNNDTGLLQAVGDLRIDTHGQTLTNTNAGDSGGIIGGGSATLMTGDLDNRAGVISSTGDLAAHAAAIDNSGGYLGGDNVELTGTALRNADGTLQAGTNLTAALSGDVDNTRGLVVTGGTLDLTAASIVNRDTLSADPNVVLGLQGESVTLNAHRIDNTAGVIAADTHIGVTGNTLDNTTGLVSSSGSIGVAVDQLTNTAGTLLSGTNQTITANGMTGDGTVLSQGDLTIALQQDYLHTGEITANGQADVSTAGTLTNRSVIQAGDLTVRGANVDNTVDGTISGGRTHVVANGEVSNRGLIDGGETRLDASRVTNSGTGRIYGDHVAIGARTLTNQEEIVGGVTTAATIASRADLDIGVTDLVNREHASLIAMGDARIGGALDGNGVATGQAQRVTNSSATIEVAGDLTLATAGFWNLNAHYVDTVVPIGSESLVDIYINDHTDNSEVPPELFGRTFSMDDFEMVYFGGWHTAGFLLGRDGTEVAGLKVFAWTETRYDRSTEESQVVSSDPGKVSVGGNLHLDGGEFVNDKSQILVGGAITGAIGALRNVAAEGQRTVTDTGAKRFTYDLGSGSNKRRIWEDQGPYQQQVNSTITLPVAEVKQNLGGIDPSGNGAGERSTGTVGGAASGAAGTSSGAGNRQVTEVGQTVAVISDTPEAANNQDVPQGEVVTDGMTVDAGDKALSFLPATVRTIGADTHWPDSSLFRSAPGASGYLIETDPAFANYRNWLSSDYLLGLLGQDPANMHKRLGDGYYEQRLVREQIGQLTGRRFLDGYASDEAQYRALLDNGATFAQKWNLRPGVALTAEQMAQLTSDIVWLVEQTVTLPDGTSATALVPQVYVRVKPGDLSGNGTLISADTIDLDLKGDLVNSGTIAGRTAVQLTGENLRNLGGRITGDTVALHARTDLDNIGGVIDANRALVATAGRDVNVVSTTNSWSTQIGANSYSNTTIDRVAGLYVTNPGGTLLVAAGRDTNLTAAQVVNAGASGQTAVVAGRNVNLNTVTVGEQNNSAADADNYVRHGYTQEVGTTIHASGDALLQAGGDINARAATVTSDHGAVTAVAEGNVNITHGVATANRSESHKSTSDHTFGSSTTLQSNSVDETFVQGSTFSGKTVGIQGQNITVTGSNVVSDAGTTLIAKENLTVEAGHDTRSESRFHQKDESGVFSDGGASITAGKRSTTTESNEVSTYAVGSMVGSLGGDTTLVAKDGALHIQGSTVSSPEGNVTLLGKSVNIEEDYSTSTTQEKTKFKQSGVTVAVSAPALDAATGAYESSRTMGESKDGRVNAMAAANTAYNAYQAAGAAKDVVQNGGTAASASITYGEQQSESETNATSREVVGSNINGKNVAIVATGAGEDSTIRISGSDVYGRDSTLLDAEGNIDIVAAQNTYELHSTNSSSGWNAGVAVSYGKDGFAAGVTAGGNVGKGHSDGTTVTHTNSHVGSGGTTTVNSGGTLTLSGGQLTGERVDVDVKNLVIESLQDTQTYDSKQMDASAQVTVGYGASVSASYNQSKVNSDYASVNEQSGILAGDRGYSVNVKDKTELKGGIITSTEAAEAAGRNSFSTGTLQIADIENHADYEGEAFGLSGSAGVNGSGERGEHQMAMGSQDGKAGGTTASKSVGFGQDDDHQRSTTHSGINTKNITITDAAGQAATGKTVDQIKAEVATATTTDTVATNSGALVNRFDAAEVQKELDLQVQVTQSFDRTQQGVRSEINASIDDARKRKEAAVAALSDKENPPTKEQVAALTMEGIDAQKDIERLQKVNVLVNMIGASLASPADGVGGIATATLAPGASYLIGQEFKKNAARNDVDNGNRPEEGSATHLLTHALLGAVVVGSGGDSALIGGLAAAGAEAAAPALAKYLYGKEAKDLTADEKETISAIVGVGGAALGSLRNDVSTMINAASAAQNAANNNWGEVGHYSTMATVLYLAGFSEQDAKAIALAAWSPDTDKRNAITLENVLLGMLPSGHQQSEHLLDGETDPAKIAAKQEQLTNQVQAILTVLKQYENDPVAKAGILSDSRIQTILHAFGDSFAHVTDGKHYPSGAGHLLDWTHPDEPDRNPVAYANYTKALYSAATTASGERNDGNVDALANAVSAMATGEEQKAALANAVRRAGGNDAGGLVNSPVNGCESLDYCGRRTPGNTANPTLREIYGVHQGASGRLEMIPIRSPVSGSIDSVSKKILGQPTIPMKPQVPASGGR